MATMNFQVPVNSKYFLNNRTEPSPPEAYLYGNGNGNGDGKNLPPSPMSGTPPSANISPTNLYSSHVSARQLRQPRQPLYIPAALRPTNPTARPTDIPNRPRAPDTPPASKENSFDSGKSSDLPAISELNVPTLDSPLAITDLDLLRRGLSRSASEGLDEEPGDVTGPPTRAHWKPDVSTNDCTICHQTFTWYFRRHHCRRCGDIVCDAHITKRVPLDQNARYHPRGFDSKACDVCWREWCIVKKLRHSRASSMADSMASSQSTTVPALQIPQNPRAADDARVGSMARSEGMVWSTF